MKVAIDAGPLYGHRTGVAVAAGGMIDGLAARGDIELVPYLVSGRARPRAGHRRLPLPGMAASQVWSRIDRPRADRWLDRADIVHGTNYQAPPSSLPTVVSVYDCWFLRHPEVARPLVRRAGAMLRRAVDRGAWIHTSSDATADAARELLHTDRVVTVPLGAPDPPAPRPGTPQRAAPLAGHRFVTAIGTEERRKGLPMLVDAFGHLAVDHPDLLLVIAGAGGDDSDAISGRIGALGPVAERVHRLGAIDDEMKGWLLRHASALAYPSLDEGFGFPVLEAHAAGLPVVAARVGSIPEIAGDAARMVTGRDPVDFATALAEVVTGTNRLGMIEAGYRNVRRFDWATTADRLVELYVEAIGR